MFRVPSSQVNRNKGVYLNIIDIIQQKKYENKTNKDRIKTLLLVYLVMQYQTTKYLLLTFHRSNVSLQTLRFLDEILQKKKKNSDSMKQHMKRKKKYTPSVLEKHEEKQSGGRGQKGGG